MAKANDETPHVGRPPVPVLRDLAAHLAMLVASAALLLVSFPKFGWWWAAHVALVPMAVLAARSARPRMLIGLAYVVSLVWWLIAVSWLIPITGGGFVAFAAYLAI